MSQRTIVLIVVVWALGILSLLGFASVNQIKPFDPSMLLAQAASNPQFDNDFAEALGQAGVTPGTLVHMVSSGNCYCDKLTEPHRQELSGELANEGYTTATDLADYIVRDLNLPFRKAYEITSKIVNYAEKNKKRFDQLSVEDVKKIEPRLKDEVLDLINLKNSIKSKKSYGGTSFENIKKMIKKYKKEIK